MSHTSLDECEILLDLFEDVIGEDVGLEVNQVVVPVGEGRRLIPTQFMHIG